MRRPDPAWLRLLLFFGALIAVLVVLILGRSIFMPLLLGLAIAYLFDPAVNWFEKRGWSRVTGVIVILLCMVLAVTGLVLYVIPEISDQTAGLRERFPEYQERLEELVGPWLERLQARYPGGLEDYRQKAQEYFEEHAPELTTYLLEGLRKTFSNVLGLVLFLLNLVFVPVFAFYLLVDLPKIKKAVSALIPLPYKESVLARVAEVNQAVSSFLRGQLTIALVLAAINATGLMILGVPLGLVIGLVAGLANMIPYMALIVGLVPALLLSWAEDQSLARLVGVVVVFTGAQLLEGTVLSPRILSKSVNLHPVVVLLAIIVGGSLFGFFGMLLAVPVAAAVQVFVRHWVRLYHDSDIYQGQDREADQEADEEAGGGAAATAGAPAQPGTPKLPPVPEPPKPRKPRKARKPRKKPKPEKGGASAPPSPS